MKLKPIHFLFIPCLFFLTQPIFAYDGISPVRESSEKVDDPAGLENPITVRYLEKNLRKKSPRLVLTPPLERKLKNKIKNDPVVGNLYEAVRLNALQILEEPLLEREVTGRRLLGVSRTMLYRMNMLGMVYRIDSDPEILQRINDELIAVCGFKDWNPQHYLDVAEMSLAVALAVDWTGEDLPASTVDLALQSLIEKGIEPSFRENGNNWWIDGENNWNQVCHGGMIAAAIVTAELDPVLAARTISRALDGMPHALDEYRPDGVYPEGSTYWSYGTSFSVLTSAMLESAFGTDFGLADYPGFMESAEFRVLSIAPSGWYYNFADCGDKRSENGDITLAWFAAQTGNRTYFEKERFLQPPEEMGRLSRLTGAALVWISQFEPEGEQKIPVAWKGDGPNPVVIFRGGKDDPNRYYFGGKGGRGTVNHGNMDAGSFVFELDGIRWVIDPGNQPYHELEKTGFDLWGDCQECDRWTLLTKNNFGHSTLTVNDALHIVDGYASIEDFKKGETGEPAEATIDLTPTFDGFLTSAKRRTVKEGPRSLLIEDEIELNENTEMITWQLMTTADVVLTDEGARLEQESKVLNLEILEPGNVECSVISLDPPPLKLDRHIENLKRIEIRVPAYLFPEGKGRIAVRLVGE